MDLAGPCGLPRGGLGAIEDGPNLNQFCCVSSATTDCHGSLGDCPGDIPWETAFARGHVPTSASQGKGRLAGPNGFN